MIKLSEFLETLRVFPIFFFSGCHADEIFFRSSTRSVNCWYGTRCPLFGLLLPSCNKYEKIWMEPKIWNLSLLPLLFHLEPCDRPKT